MQGLALDHLVLTVADIERTCRFYVDGLGMERRAFAKERVALHFGGQKINLHPASAPIAPHARRPTPGSADLCFLTATPVADVAAELAGRGIDIVEGPVDRSGAQGPLRSIYCYDPDGNLIEIANRR
ncbi:VOC family protein [Shumkonia mesophila]|uniref:VOC family protein n=1 Tax=Shumkonia mesophila TaxID=2838854 RepID=UPI002934B1C8|nr:VOC family protein [Shumkonia mesophila]